MNQRQRERLIREIEKLAPQASAGKTTGYYVPEAAHAAVRNGIEAWNRIQVCLRELVLANKERLIPSKSRVRPRKRPA